MSKSGKSFKKVVATAADRIVTRRDVDPPMCNNCIQPVSDCKCVARHVRAT